MKTKNDIRTSTDTKNDMNTNKDIIKHINLKTDINNYTNTGINADVETSTDISKATSQINNISNEKGIVVICKDKKLWDGYNMVINDLTKENNNNIRDCVTVLNDMAGELGTKDIV